MANEVQTPVQKKFDDKTIDAVLERINFFQNNRQLKLPSDYSPENALKSAWLILLDTKDANKQPVLESCTKESIANALLKMVIQALSPLKNQGYFIAYGNQLIFQRSYLGSLALAKRLGGVKKISANAVFKNDEFEYTIEPESGNKKVTKHLQKLENLDHENTIGAYAILTLEDGSRVTEIMNIKQLQKSWDMGKAKGDSPAHKNFKDQMAIKTVISRACKLLINSTDDSDLYEDDEVDDNAIETQVKTEIKDKANRKTLPISQTLLEDSSENKTQPPAEGKKENEKKQEPQKKKEPEVVNNGSDTNGPGF